MNEFELSIEKPASKFQNHLDLDGNNRIFFSGKFGSGKTYFLEKFFAERKDKYLSIRLAPVNYSVASNEDIFKFIKYDILYELNRKYNGVLFDTLAKYCELDSLTEFASAIITAWKTTNILETATTAISAVELSAGKVNLIGSGIKAGFDKLTGYFKTQKDLSEARKSYPNFEPAMQFFENNAKSYLYEEDAISWFIRSVLDLLTTQVVDSEEVTKKEKVLIIDDLDRLDPEHTFRLFNVFSSHFDYDQEYENKFGFDKIIFCGDIENIRQIFHAKYGSSTDFSGYIDKFYSEEIFHFNNSEIIIEKITELLYQFNEKADLVKLLDDYFHQDTLLVLLFRCLIKNKVLTPRNLKKIYERKKYNFTSNKQSRHIGNNKLKKNYGSAIFQFLNLFFTDSEALIIAFEKCQEEINNFGVEVSDELMKFLIPILDYKNHKFIPNIPFKYISNRLRFEYTLTSALELEDTFKTFDEKGDEIFRFDFYEELIKSLRILQKLEIIQ